MEQEVEVVHEEVVLEEESASDCVLNIERHVHEEVVLEEVSASDRMLNIERHFN